MDTYALEAERYKQDIGKVEKERDRFKSQITELKSAIHVCNAFDLLTSLISCFKFCTQSSFKNRKTSETLNVFLFFMY
jgi:hypothetical protein